MFRGCVYSENRCIQHEAAAVGREWSDSVPSSQDSCSVQRLNSAELDPEPCTQSTFMIFKLLHRSTHSSTHPIFLYQLILQRVTKGSGSYPSKHWVREALHVIWNPLIVMLSFVRGNVFSHIIIIIINKMYIWNLSNLSKSFMSLLTNEKMLHKPFINL